jgi:hypothetical protein
MSLHSGSFARNRQKHILQQLIQRRGVAREHIADCFCGQERQSARPGLRLWRATTVSAQIFFRRAQRLSNGLYVDVCRYRKLPVQLGKDQRSDFVEIVNVWGFSGIGQPHI